MNNYDYIYLGPTPSDEDCAQLGTEDYYPNAMLEIKAYINQLEREFPIPESIDASYMKKSEHHDFGTYWEVVIKLNIHDEAAINFAFNVESNGPRVWDKIARKELGL